MTVVNDSPEEVKFTAEAVGKELDANDVEGTAGEGGELRSMDGDEAESVPLDVDDSIGRVSDVDG